MTVIASTISGNTGTNGVGASIASRHRPPGRHDRGRQHRGQLRRSGAANLQSAGYNLTDDKTGTACDFTTATDLVNKNPLLGHLANNGGPTQTLLPGAKSPAANVIPTGTTLRGRSGLPRHRSARRRPARAR